jgi:NAD(P)H-quinone oxidoreductase subunit N
MDIDQGGKPTEHPERPEASGSMSLGRQADRGVTPAQVPSGGLPGWDLPISVGLWQTPWWIVGFPGRDHERSRPQARDDAQLHEGHRPHRRLEARLASGTAFDDASKYPNTPIDTQLRVVAARLHTSNSFAMPLLLTGRGFRRDLESVGALALYAPLEGGAETRLLRRMRAVGYHTQLSTCRGLGDPESFLLGLHGVRPPHLGHQRVGREAAVGDVQLVMPQLGPALASDRPVLLWLLEGQVLSAAERRSLVALCLREKNLFMVVEMGGARALRWSPLDAVTDD